MKITPKSVTGNLGTGKLKPSFGSVSPPDSCRSKNGGHLLVVLIDFGEPVCGPDFRGSPWDFVENFVNALHVLFE